MKQSINLPRTEVVTDAAALSQRCAEFVRECLQSKPDALLCFPAGSTVIGSCEVFIDMNNKGEIDFSHANFVALDEWLDLEDDSENCTNFLRKHLYGPLDLREDQLHLFNTEAPDLDAECRRIDDYIFSQGGIALMLLGLGMNGHLGLNEPGSSFDDYAKVVDLDQTTAEVGQKYFSGPMTLSRGITLGIGHMFEAKEVILQISGSHKQDIVHEMYTTPATPDLPGTVFQELPHSLVILDEKAAARITDIL